jgi:hypothetical protein
MHLLTCAVDVTLNGLGRAGLKAIKYVICAGIFKQSLGARNQVGKDYRTGRQATYAGGIDSLVPGLLKSLKIRAHGTKLEERCLRVRYVVQSFLCVPPDLCFRCHPERAGSSAGDAEQPGRAAGRHLQDPDHHPRPPLPTHQGQLPPFSFSVKYAKSGFRISIHLMRIRIRSGSKVFMTKKWEKFTA